MILESEEHEDDPVALAKARAAYKACISMDYADQLQIPEGNILEKVDWPLILQSSSENVKLDWNVVGNLIATYGVQLFFEIEVKPNLFDAHNIVIYVS